MKISRDGHRARMRAAYLQGGGDAMPDHQLLELLLSISIPRKDVKPIAYALINRFGSLEQVFAAGAADLQQVPGVGEQTAVQILLVRDLNRRIRQNQNKPVKHLTDATQSCAYFANLLRDKTTEQVYLVTMDGSAKILQTHAVGSGSVNLASVDQRTLMEHILRDNASAVMLAHNHPAARPSPLLRIWNSPFVCFPFCVPFMCSCWIILSSVLPTPTPCAATRSTAASSPSNNAMYKRNRSLALRFLFSS